MIKKLWPYTKGYRLWIVLGIACSACEAVFELLLPLVMAVISMLLGVGAAFMAARAGQGFGAQLRDAQYDHIQDFSFRNIEKFSTASLVTRLTNDCSMMQMSLAMAMRMMIRAPMMLISALVLATTISLKLSGVFLVAMPLLLVMVVAIFKLVGPLFSSLQERTDDLKRGAGKPLRHPRGQKLCARKP